MKLDLTRRQLNRLIGLGLLTMWLNAACRAHSANPQQTPTPALDGPAFLYFYTDN